MKSFSAFFQHLPVGTVEVSPDGELSFVYSKDWQNSRRAVPISMSMPLWEEVHRSCVMSPWLANLLPEEEQLEVLARSLGMSQGDPQSVEPEKGINAMMGLALG